MLFDRNDQGLPNLEDLLHYSGMKGDPLTDILSLTSARCAEVGILVAGGSWALRFPVRSHTRSAVWHGVKEGPRAACVETSRLPTHRRDAGSEPVSVLLQQRLVVRYTRGCTETKTESKETTERVCYPLRAMSSDDGDRPSGRLKSPSPSLRVPFRLVRRLGVSLPRAS